MHVESTDPVDRNVKLSESPPDTAFTSLTVCHVDRRFHVPGQPRVLLAHEHRQLPQWAVSGCLPRLEPLSVVDSDPTLRADVDPDDLHAPTLSRARARCNRVSPPLTVAISTGCADSEPVSPPCPHPTGDKILSMIPRAWLQFRALVPGPHSIEINTAARTRARARVKAMFRDSGDKGYFLNYLSIYLSRNTRVSRVPTLSPPVETRN